MEWSPYVVELLKARWQLYIDAVQGSYSQQDYTVSVQNWYGSHGYYDSSGNFSMGKALGTFEDSWRLRNPNKEWNKTPNYYQSKKSHHGVGQQSKDLEKADKKRWRQSEKGIESTRRSRELAKMRRLGGTH
jgi:hypothetical protein